MERKLQYSFNKNLQEKVPFADSVGVATDEQAKPYKSMLLYGDKFRLFNESTVLEVLQVIPGEAGKMLREAYDLGNIHEMPEEDRMKFNRKVIRTFYRNQPEPKDVRFLPQMRPDGSRAKTSPLIYPAAISPAVFT